MVDRNGLAHEGSSNSRHHRDDRKKRSVDPLTARAPNPLQLSELTVLALMAKNNAVPEHK